MTSRKSTGAGLPPIILHGYWRSGTSFRTRLALEYKRLSYIQVAHDLREGQHQEQQYLALNPQGLVPAVQCGDRVFTQSSAIIEWLDEVFPSPALLPPRPPGRAIVRAMAMTIACDIHPLNNLRVLKALRDDFSASDQAVQSWIAAWTHAGFTALETMVAEYGGRFCFGDQFSLADCHLIPQVYSAERLDIPLDAYPRIREITRSARTLEWVVASHPDNQPDRHKTS